MRRSFSSYACASNSVEHHHPTLPLSLPTIPAVTTWIAKGIPRTTQTSKEEREEQQGRKEGEEIRSGNLGKTILENRKVVGNQGKGENLARLEKMIQKCQKIHN